MQTAALVVVRAILLSLLIPLLALGADPDRRGPISRSGFDMALKGVRDGIMNPADLVALVVKRGVNFRLTPEEQARLIRAGAAQGLLQMVADNYIEAESVAEREAKSLRTPAAAPAPAPAPVDLPIPAGPPLTLDQVVILLQAGVPLSRVEKFVVERKAAFAVTPPVSKQIHDSGGSFHLVGAIVANTQAPPEPPAPVKTVEQPSPPATRPGAEASGRPAPAVPGTAQATTRVQPRMVRGPKPEYPLIARQRGVSGAVTVLFTVAADGSIRNARATDGPALLRDAAVQAVRKYLYEPGLVNGKPADTEVSLSLNFSLK